MIVKLARASLFPVGSIVGCRYRWPYHANHPDCWQEPHIGEVLAVNDPRAWSDTLAFPGRKPSQGEVDIHLGELAESNFGIRSIPVLWKFRFDNTEGVCWETPSSLRPYRDELAAWQLARRAAYQRLTGECHVS